MPSIWQSSLNHLDAEALEMRFGMRVAAALHPSTQALPHSIEERLRHSRELALARVTEVRMARQRVAAGTTQVLNSHSANVGSLSWMPPWGAKLASALPLLVLVAGLVLIEDLHKQAQIAAAAEVDAALLIDDLPPSAYADPGFVQFLRAPLE